VDVNGDARASVTVRNTGKRPGVEVVQLYAADTATGVTLPARQLIGFARLELAPGASKTVTFDVQNSVNHRREQPRACCRERKTGSAPNAAPMLIESGRKRSGEGSFPNRLARHATAGLTLP
jgi:hypothetical protein